MQDLQQQSAMLQKEYEYEKELYRQQTREAGIPKRIQQGVCWFPVKLGADRYNSLNQLTVESIIGAIVAIIVSVLGAILANKNTIILQTRKLKEEHYIAYIEALHNYAASDINDKDALKNYVYMRDKLLLIANEKVIIKLLEFEDKGVGKTTDLHRDIQ